MGIKLNQGLKEGINQVIAKEKGKTYMTGEIRLIDFAEDCLRELERLERLAMHQSPMQINIQQYDIIVCPSCDYDLSEYILNKNYRVDEARVDKVKFCLNCGQSLEWTNKL